MNELQELLVNVVLPVTFVLVLSWAHEVKKLRRELEALRNELQNAREYQADVNQRVLEILQGCNSIHKNNHASYGVLLKHFKEVLLNLEMQANNTKD